MRAINRILLFFISVLVGIQPSDAQDNLYGKAKAELLKGEYSQAVKTFSQVAIENPDDVLAWLGKGEAYFNLMEYDMALRDFYTAQSIESNISSFWISKCYAMKSDPVKSLEALGNHLNSPYKLPEKEILLEPSYRKIEKSREWRSFWKNDWYKPYENQKSDAAYQISRGNYSEAIEELNVLLNQNADDAQLYYLRSMAYSNKGEENRGLIDLNIALNKDPDNPEYREERAKVYRTMGRQEDAVKDYSAVIKNYPEDFDAYLKRASALLEIKKYNQALLDVNYYLGFFENDHEAQFFAGEICYESGKYHDAVKYLNKALDLNKGNEKYFIARANTYVKMNTLGQAINDYSMALDLNPNDADIYFNRGIARLKANNSSDACYDFMKAFKMGKREALEYLQRNCGY